MIMNEDKKSLEEKILNLNGPFQRRKEEFEYRVQIYNPPSQGKNYQQPSKNYNLDQSDVSNPGLIEEVNEVNDPGNSYQEDEYGIKNYINPSLLARKKKRDQERNKSIFEVEIDRIDRIL